MESFELHPSNQYILVYLDGGGGSRLPSCDECDVYRLELISFLFSPFLNQFGFAARLVCSFGEAMASTTVLSAKVALADSNVVGRSAVYSRYNDGCTALHSVLKHEIF
jgi:hypothetical protein